MRRILNNAISLIVVVIVLFLVIPLHPSVLDVLLILNISLSIMILMITMNISEPLEFSIFPSLLLITTLFRLGLNVSSTRLILKNGGNAGVVIKAFGDLITQGNIVIGILIFLIIVLVQFIVITKGAERVSEVAARFTLDAMPGKQMAIDADLSSGLINEKEARLRRQKIQREADFYGAMDGATKIVKGDAVMSLIITVINFVAGLIIGIVQGGGDLSTVLSVYSIATIGDGLVSQLPALMISTATGMIVTRSVSDGSLNTDVISQFKAQPRAIMATGMILLMLGLFPGTPTLPLLLVGAVLSVGGYWSDHKMALARQMEEAESARAGEAVPELQAASEADYYKDINNVYSLLTVEPIEMEFGYSLIPLVDEASGGKLISRIVIFRRQYAQDMGFVIPSIRLHDGASLGTNQYIIKIRGEEVARGEILVDYYLALEPSNPTGEIDGIETVEPAYGIPSRWILPENKEMAEIYGYTVITPLTVMLTHLSETIKKHTYELLNRSETIQLVEHLKQTEPELVADAIPNVVSYANLEKILKSLLREGIPIKDLATILEAVVEASGGTRDIDMITEQVRSALSRTITRRFCENGQLRVVTLDAEVEKKVLAALTKNDHGVYLALSPDIMQQIIAQLGELRKKFNDLSQTPIVLTSQIIRVYLSRMIAQFYPDVYVLSFHEITSSVQIQAIGNITLQQQNQPS
ncbi:MULTISPECIES: flagellar biosynthesis protein FlhA [Eubacteriales]|uniref:flagellar biosynthesis protein FlhA n=1 Tax=Eubacteriales TaxID=186802 RepID=UPI000D2A93E8|nr:MULTISPECIES: flagellar biosynthesis protein FlhA [Eubacteriales]MCB5925292.1 flagellar biosynthesis protein FlhA [bacterium 210820-DFI.5.26]MCQ5159016.1 flagellar biosynthesis protein FlhA [Clostridium sp. DFI.5.61]UMM47562.1 flagellar biosynthesis protein FlhA [Lawsonibacter asaccharolyticus]GBF67633.1 flagellar biosynthesis protein FlhA [Lawsonibacter asaccharolyticus]